MSSFKGTDFEIDLPLEFSDESTYAFAFPARADFRPSVAIKTERPPSPVEISTYAAQQIEKLGKLLPNLVLVGVQSTQHDRWPACTSVYDWGEPARRIRQKQYYILLSEPTRVVTLTGTSTKDTFAQTEALFDAIFRSFRPTNPPRREA